MRWVQSAVTAPNKCAVLPYIGRDHDLGFIDTGSELPGRGDRWDSHVYVSVVAARELANFIGYHSPETVQAMQETVQEAQAERDAALARVAELEAAFGAIDALESEGLRARKKAGRKPKHEVEAVA